MSLFPKVTSPCPYKSQLAAVMDGDFCRMCQRQVFDLDGFSDGERRAFLAGCEEEVCVSYRVPIRAVMAAAAFAVATPAAAQDQPPAAAVQLEPDLSGDMEMGEEFIIVGGIKDPANADFVTAEDASGPELPIVYEDEEPSEAGADRAPTLLKR